MPTVNERWLPSLELLLRLVPRARDVLVETRHLEDAYGRGEFGDAAVESPGQVWNTLMLTVMDYERPRLEFKDFWPGYLSYVELAAEALDRLQAASDQPDEDKDAAELGTFVDAGVICDITSDRRGFEALLPYLGPRSVCAAHAEVGAHRRVLHDWGGQDIDWRPASSLYKPAAATPADLLPVDRRD